MNDPVCSFSQSNLGVVPQERETNEQFFCLTPTRFLDKRHSITKVQIVSKVDFIDPGHSLYFSLFFIAFIFLVMGRANYRVSQLTMSETKGLKNHLFGSENVHISAI